jgi:hypothetical protein
VKLFEDPTPSAIINLRYVTKFVGVADTFTDIGGDEFTPYLRSLLFVGKKLVAVWSHLDRYTRLEDALIAKAQEESPLKANDIQHIVYAQDLFIELDEFLVQIKSTLDYLAKLPRTIVGKKNWPDLRTFGDKGSAVEKAVRNNFPAAWKDNGEFVLRALEKYRPWLEMAIAARDKINHGKDGGIDFEAFVVSKTNRNGRDEIVVPMWTDDLSLREYMKSCWHNLLGFAEQFTMSFLSVRLKEGIGFVYLPKAPDSPDSPFVVAPFDAVDQIVAVSQHLQGNRQSPSKEPPVGA